MSAVQINQTGKLDALLAAYCAGTLTPVMQALVGSHLELCRDNHGFVDALDGLQGTQLMQAEPQPATDRTAQLAAIFAAAPLPAAPRTEAPNIWPVSLQKILNKDLNAIVWRRLLPGIRQYRLSHEIQGEAVLYWIKAGRKMPFHTHDGSEVTLVLQGAFSDANGRYGRGDVAIADSEINHQPVVDKDGDCICFAVTDAPLRLTGPVGRILDRLFGHHH